MPIMYNSYRTLTFCSLLSIWYFFSLTVSFLHCRDGIIRTKHYPSIRSEGFGIPLKADKSDNTKENEPFRKFPFIDPPSFIKEISLPSLMAGAIGGSIISVFAIFSPFFFGEESILSSSVLTNDIEKIAEPVTLFQDILVDLNNDYVDKIDTVKLFKTGMKAMLKSLDPYTEFEDLEAAKSMQESVSGKYGGVGLVISNKIDQNPIGALKKESKPGLDNSVSKQSSQKKALEKESNKGVSVVDAFEGYAYDAGIRVGDRILSVNGVDTRQMSVDKVRDLLRGDPDTDIVVEVSRDGDIEGKTGVEAHKLQRQLVKISDIRIATLLGNPNDGIGYINLGGFNSGSAKDFRTAFLLLRYSAPQDLKGLILDLRGNPGGLLDMAVEIATLLVPEQSDIVTAKSKNGQEIVYRSNSKPIRPADMKLAVLVNKGSASASEIVSGAVQDLDAGIIVGPSTTYGKGLVQKIIPLPYDAALKYTIAKYYTPSGRCIQSIKYTGGREDATILAASTTTTSPIEEKESLQPDETKIDNKDKSQFLVPPSSSVPSSRESSTVVAAVTTTAAAEEDENSNRPPLPIKTAPSSEDGGMEIPDNERHEFLTKFKHRVVRDGGGIEPDYKVKPIKMGPAESLLYSQGIYSDFAGDYFRRHSDQRETLRQGAVMERQLRDAEPTFAQGSFGSATTQYLVVNPSVLEVHSKKAFGGEKIGITGAVPTSFFWGQPLDERFKDALYQDFKSYVLKRIDRQDLATDLALRSQLEDLKTALASAGLEKVAVSVEDLRPKIRSAILEDMDKNKKFITDGVELALLSRELPDRLIFYHTIIQDDQVHTAFQLVSGKTLPTSGKDSPGTKKAIPPAIEKGEQKVKPPGSVTVASSSVSSASGLEADSAAVSYDSLLFGE